MRKFDFGDFVTSSLKTTPSVDQKRKHLLHVCIIIIIIIIIIIVIIVIITIIIVIINIIAVSRSKEKASHLWIHTLAFNYNECQKVKLIINQTDTKKKQPPSMYPHIIKVVWYWKKHKIFFNLCFLFSFSTSFSNYKILWHVACFAQRAHISQVEVFVKIIFLPKCCFVKTTRMSGLFVSGVFLCENRQLRATTHKQITPISIPQIAQDKYNENTLETSLQIISICFQGTLLLGNSLNRGRLIEFSLLKAGLLPVDFYFLQAGTSALLYSYFGYFWHHFDFPFVTLWFWHWL